MNEKPESTDPSDDGRTIADMSFDWMPWNRGIVRRGKRRKRERAARDQKDWKNNNFATRSKGNILRCCRTILYYRRFYAHLPVIAALVEILRYL